MHRFTAVAALFTIILFAGSGFASAQTRRITFNNLCSYPVWFGFVSGAVPLAFCSTGCPNGSHCDPTNNNCYWDAPTPDDGNYKLLPNASNSATLHFINNSQSILWSGAITGRTGCRSGAQCTVADCGTPNPDTDACTHGFAQPATQAEVTFLKKGDDTYDVTVINGLTIPVEVKPKPTTPVQGDAYRCGNAGGAVPITSGGLGGCSWEFEPPSPYYTWVSAGGRTCSANNNCSNGQVCGLNAEGGNTQLTCGTRLGYYTAHQVCGLNGAFGYPFYCASHLPLYHCVGAYPNSCYSDGAVGTNCCGCVNWDSVGIPTPSVTPQCGASNPAWVSVVLPTIQWIKEGCPTAYTYPYDDKSTTFTCVQMDGSNNNVLDYEINFCKVH